MLRNVRSYLHPFLYRVNEDTVSSMVDFLDVFGALNASVDPAVISENLGICGQLYEVQIQ